MWYTQNKKKPWTKKGEEITGNTRVEVGLLDPVKCKQIPCKKNERSKLNSLLAGCLSLGGLVKGVFLSACWCTNKLGFLYPGGLITV